MRSLIGCLLVLAGASLSAQDIGPAKGTLVDRKSTRLNSSHQ